MSAGEIHRASVPFNVDGDVHVNVNTAVEIVFEDTSPLVFAIRP